MQSNAWDKFTDLCTTNNGPCRYWRVSTWTNVYHVVRLPHPHNCIIAKRYVLLVSSTYFHSWWLHPKNNKKTFCTTKLLRAAATKCTASSHNGLVQQICQVSFLKGASFPPLVSINVRAVKSFITSIFTRYTLIWHCYHVIWIIYESRWYYHHMKRISMRNHGDKII